MNLLRSFCLVVSFLAGTSSLVLAQDEEEIPIPLRVLAADTKTPLPSVEIYGPSGGLLRLGDALGFVGLPPSLADSLFAVVSAEGYTPDTLRPPFPAELVMQPRGKVLAEVTVRAGIPVPVTPSHRDAVVDYSFVGDYLLLATSRAATKASLLLLDARGDTLAHAGLREIPDAVYTACDGTPYVTFPDRFYALSAAGGEVEIGQRYASRLLSRLHGCQLSINGTLYYKQLSDTDMALLYYMLPAGDTVFRTFIRMQDREAALGRADEQARVESYGLRAGDDGSHRTLAGMKDLRDRAALRELDVPLLRYHDTLLVPNLAGRRLIFFGLDGSLLKSVPLRWQWGPLVRFTLLQDAATGKIYLHRQNRPYAQTVQEIDPQTGTLVGRVVRVQKPFAEKVRIRGGRIYFLWQNDRALAARQLFVQVAFDEQP